MGEQSRKFRCLSTGKQAAPADLHLLPCPTLKNMRPQLRDWIKQSLVVGQYMLVKAYPKTRSLRTKRSTRHRRRETWVARSTWAISTLTQPWRIYLCLVLLFVLSDL